MTILVYSPASSDRSTVLQTLESSGHDVVVIDCPAAKPADGGADLFVVDLRCPDAMKFLRRHAPHRDRAPVVCIGNRRHPELSSDALRLGVADIVAAPVTSDDLLAALANAAEMLTLARRADPLPEAPEAPGGVFGASPAMRDVLGIVRRLSHSRCGVLIVGERGTGREMIARTIHAQGPRVDRPFVKVLCGQPMSVDLDRLLGDGTVSGATIYLENVCELPADLQLRLESRMRQPGFGAVPVADPPRFIAAALPRIDEWVERGRVRRMLVEAIAVVRMDLPSLRQRSHDVPLLAMHFLKEACRQNDVPAKTFSRSALTLLSALPWRGNAAELRSLAERLAVLVPRGVVLLEDILANVKLDDAEAVGRARGSLKEARERFERDYVTSILRQHRGRMGTAARELGIERTNLYRKIRQLNIRWTGAD